jgi:hypothetical protein
MRRSRRSSGCSSTALATLARRWEKLPANEREWIKEHAPEVLAAT